jgi:ribosomal protein S27AE
LTRPLVYVALALMLLGIEVATGTVSLAAARMGAGLSAVLSGDEYVISAARYLSGVAILFASGGMLAAIGWAEIRRRGILPEGAVCPRCGTATKRVRRRMRHRILSWILETNVTRWHCERCGWNGLAT